MKLSVVIPVFNERDNLQTLTERLQAALTPLTDQYELLFVDDGSRDGSEEWLIARAAADPHVKAIVLSRNFGHQMALTAGMDRASGDAVIVMDADLQHPPEIIPELVRQWQAGFEVVYTVRDDRHAGLPWTKRMTTALFYPLFSWLSGVDLPANTADFRLLDRKVVAALAQVRERARFLRGLTRWVGFRQTGVPYQAPVRRAGESKYSFWRMLHLAVDGLVSFSTAPLVAAMYLGFAIAFAGFVYGGYALYARFVTLEVLPGWTSLLIFAALIGGLQLIMMGIFGLYLGRLYEEVKQRPLYLVRRDVGFPAA